MPMVSWRDGRLVPDGANGTSGFFPLGNNPVAVNVVNNGNFVYAVNETDHTVSAFQVGSDGALSSIGLFTVGFGAQCDRQ